MLLLDDKSRSKFPVVCFFIIVSVIFCGVGVVGSFIISFSSFAIGEGGDDDEELTEADDDETDDVEQ